MNSASSSSCGQTRQRSELATPSLRMPAEEGVAKEGTVICASAATYLKSKGQTCHCQFVAVVVVIVVAVVIVLVMVVVI